MDIEEDVKEFNFGKKLPELSTNETIIQPILPKGVSIFIDILISS